MAIRHNGAKIVDSEGWIPAHAIRQNANGSIDILVEKGTLSNPGKKKSVVAKLKKIFSGVKKRVGLRNPVNSENFGSLPIGSIFKFASSDTTLRYSGGGRFMGQNVYRKIGSTTYVPADEQAALSDLRKKYSGYPDIAKKLNRKSITLRVGSKKAEIVRQ